MITIILEFLLLAGLGPRDNLDYYLQSLQPEEFIADFGDHLGLDWKPDDLRYAALFAWTEAGSLGEDAALSVLSTPQARLDDPDWCTPFFCAETYFEEIRRPGQYLGPEAYSDNAGNSVYRDVPSVAYLWAYKYAIGSRGSCNHYICFNADPGGPATCQLGTIDFHSEGKC